MRIQLPDYNNCCVNLMNSVAKYFGLEPKHPTLPLVDAELLRGYKNVVVISEKEYKKMVEKIANRKAKLSRGRVI